MDDSFDIHKAASWLLDNRVFTMLARSWPPTIGEVGYTQFKMQNDWLMDALAVIVWADTGQRDMRKTGEAYKEMVSQCSAFVEKGRHPLEFLFQEVSQRLMAQTQTTA